MLRKVCSLVIALVMVIICIPINTFAIEETGGNDTDIGIVSYENDELFYTSTEIEGSVIRAEYTKNTNEYSLYRDEVKYSLKVETQDTYVLVDIVDDEGTDSVMKDELFYGQNPVALAFAYWTPEAIAAAEAVICSMLAYTSGKIAYFSINSIATTIKGVKNGTISKARLKTQAGVTSYWALKLSRTRQQNNYYAAMLQNNTVYIGPKLTSGGAKYRLKAGYDVFATNSSTANYIAVSASPVRMAVSHPAHRSGEGYYPHYHPVGLPWYKNRNHNPHVWYPYS